jgi:hypothetical protein
MEHFARQVLSSNEAQRRETHILKAVGNLAIRQR